MIDKRGGKVAYAVMSFGGFLGIGDEYGALPWSLLKYNERLDAYELNVTKGQLRYAPMPAHGLDAGGGRARVGTQRSRLLSRRAVLVMCKWWSGESRSTFHHYDLLAPELPR